MKISGEGSGSSGDLGCDWMDDEDGETIFTVKIANNW